MLQKVVFLIEEIREGEIEETLVPTMEKSKNIESSNRGKGMSKIIC